MTDLEISRDDNDRIKGLIYGCALGDAFGLQYEGISKEHISEREGIHINITFRTDGTWHGVDFTDWTDDTDQLILLMEVLTENKNVYDPCIFAKKIHYWRWHGFPELGDECGMGVGQLTAKVISDENFLTNPIKTSAAIHKALGSDRAPNGAIMRAGIMAFAKNWATASILQAKTTHANMKCIKSSLILAYICKNLASDTMPDDSKIRDILDDYPYFDVSLSDLKLDDESRGYTYKTLACGLWVLDKIRNLGKSVDFVDIIQQITFEGGDTDTNCAVAGQILGAYLGYERLPSEWIALLKNKEWLDKKIKLYLEVFRRHT